MAATLWVVAGCGGASAGPDTSTSLTASEAEWRQIAVPRPPALTGAPRVAVSEVQFVGNFPWRGPSTVSAELAVAELVATGLLRRRDVHFIERRRFAVAAEAERRGIARPRGAPPAGVSPSADFTTTAVWLQVDAEHTVVEVRLTGLESGRVAGATRVDVAPDADAVSLARAIVEGALEVLAELDRLPEWSDPLDVVTERRAVSSEALTHFLRGLAAEESWNWEGARRAYQQASSDPSFHEASTALARAARLRLGGTLAES